MEYYEKHERLECYEKHERLERLVSAQLNRELKTHKSPRKHGVLRKPRVPGAPSVLRKPRVPGAPRQHPVRMRRPKFI